jgi:NhaA family Na+:H+ antiporter
MTTPPRRLHWIILDSAIVLPLGCAVALVWANLAPEPYYRFAHAVDFPIDEVGLAFFFAIMTKHVVEETLPGGTLHSWRGALLPVAAAVGGVLLPIAIYLGYLWAVDEPMLQSAWVLTTAIDVAVCYLVGSLIFGRHPALPFLVLLSIASNAIGLAVLAVTNPPTIVHALVGLTIVLAGMVGAQWLRRHDVQSAWLYVLGPGVLCWCGLYFAGVHPALALVPVVPFMPHARRDPGLMADPLPSDRDTLSRFERVVGPPVQAVLFLFGLANAGVPLHGLESGAWALPIAAIVGRPIGVVATVAIATRLGLHPTGRVGVRELIVIGFITATGLTMALFFAAATYSIGPLQSQSSLGALITAASPALAWAAAWLLGVGRYRRTAAIPEPA